jgi:hypothetical protein
MYGHCQKKNCRNKQASWYFWLNFTEDLA